MSDNLDNSEWMRQLVQRQMRTNLLLAMGERRARRDKREIDKARIAERYGVDPSQVILDDLTYAIIGRPKA